MAQLTAMSDTARETALATIRAALGLTGMEDADDIASEITARLGPLLPAPTAKTMGVTHAILGSDNPNDPSTYSGIDAMTRPGKTTDGERVRARPGEFGYWTRQRSSASVSLLLLLTIWTLLGRIEMVDDPDSDDAEDMIPNADNFMPVPGSEVSLAKGFTSNNYMRSVTNDDDETTTDEIAVVTDMKDPGPLTWAGYYMVERKGTTGAANTDDPGDDDAQPRIGQISVETGSTDPNFDLSLISASTLPSGDTQTFTFVDDDAGGGPTELKECEAADPWTACSTVLPVSSRVPEVRVRLRPTRTASLRHSWELGSSCRVIRSP